MADPASVYFCPARTPYLVSDAVFSSWTSTPVSVYALSSGYVRPYTGTVPAPALGVITSGVPTALANWPPRL